MSRSKKRIAVVLSFALCASLVSSHAEEQEGSPQGPRIGLVLSGGGARGTAHVGVLRVLEELQIPIHCIAGTSMGAIISGFYAAGLSPDEIEEILVTMDWNAAFNETVPRQELTFRRKEEDQRYPFNMELGFKDGRFKAQSGMLAGQNLNLILRGATLHISDETHFDTLRIPYRAVAVDLDEGTQVIIDKGDIAKAMRASMSIPGVFTPVEINGHRCIDGGVLNNLPVDVAKQMGADIVIAVDVRAPLNWRGKSESVLAVSAQAIEIAIRRGEAEQAANADVVVRPDLAGYTAADFEKAKPMIDRGTLAAELHEDKLISYSVSADDYQRYLDRQRAKQIDTIQISDVQISGNDTVDERRIRSRITTKPGDVVDMDELRAEVLRIYGLGEFEAVMFSIEGDGDAKTLVYETLEKPWGPNYFHAGLKIQDDFEGNSSYGVLLNFTKTRLNPLGGEWRTDLQFGETLAAYTEFYQPLDFDSTFFIAPSFTKGEYLQDLYDGNRRIAEYSVEELDLGLDLGTELGKYGEFRLGYHWGTAKADVEVGSPTLPDYDVQYAGLFTRAVFDRLDDANFPRSGSRSEIMMVWSREDFGSDRNYEKLLGGFGKFQSVGRNTFFVEAGAGSALDSDMPDYDEFTIGGLFSLAGYGEEQLRGKYFATVSAGYFFKILPLPPGLGEGVYLGAKCDAGNAWQERENMDVEDLRYGGAFFLGGDTILGPIYLAYGMAEQDNQRFYFSVGSTF